MRRFVALVFLISTKVSLATAQELVAVMPRDAARDCACIPSISQRDLATITSAFSAVGSGIADLDTAAKALNGAGDLAPLQAASSRLLSAIQAGTASVQASSPLSLQESVQLQEVVTGLQSRGDSLANTLESKKSTIQSLGLCKIFQLQVDGVAKASQGLSDAVVGKVPEAARQIAAELAGGFTGTLDKTKDLFAEGNCINSPAGGSDLEPGTPENPGQGTGTGNASRNGTVVTAGAASIGEGLLLGSLVGAVVIGLLVPDL